MDLSTARIETVYQQMLDYWRQFDGIWSRKRTPLDYWKQFSEIWSRKQNRTPPILALTNVENQKAGAKAVLTERVDAALMNTEFYPKRPSEKELNLVIMKYLTIGYAGCCYIPHEHIILINRKNHTGILDLAEETIHSVANISENFVFVPRESFKYFNGCVPNLGQEISEVIELTFPSSQNELYIMPGEFFVPFGIMYLLPDLYFPHDFGKHFINMKNKVEHMRSQNNAENSDFDTRKQVRNLIEHLPVLAGEFMVRLYQGDVEALLKEHPQLPHLNGPQVWTQYCEPLLTHGKL